MEVPACQCEHLEAPHYCPVMNWRMRRNEHRLCVNDKKWRAWMYNDMLHNRPRGLGDRIAHWLHKLWIDYLYQQTRKLLGIKKPCTGCNKRQDKLNQIAPSKPCAGCRPNEAKSVE